MAFVVLMQVQVQPAAQGIRLGFLRVGENRLLQPSEELRQWRHVLFFDESLLAVTDADQLALHRLDHQRHAEPDRVHHIGADLDVNHLRYHDNGIAD